MNIVKVLTQYKDAPHQIKRIDALHKYFAYYNSQFLPVEEVVDTLTDLEKRKVDLIINYKIVDLVLKRLTPQELLFVNNYYFENKPIAELEKVMGLSNRAIFRFQEKLDAKITSEYKRISLIAEEKVAE